jgi:hypothetical protein
MKNTKSGYTNSALEAAREAIKLYKQEEREKNRKTSFHNIGKLMDNYLDFVEHYEKIKYRAKDIEDYLENMDIYGVIVGTEDSEIQIEAIKRSKTRTLIVVTQIQTAVGMLKDEMETKGEYEKYLVVKMLYMDPAKKSMKFNQKVKLVADDVKCNEVTVRRWNTEMLNRLAVKLFGVDGLRLDV